MSNRMLQPTKMKTGYLGDQLLRDLRVESNTGLTGEVQLSMLGNGVIGCVLVYAEKPEKCLGYVEYQDRNAED
jgi:hypothetical protein